MTAPGRRHRRQKLATAGDGATGPRSVSAGVYDEVISEVVAHLLRASAAVDRLSRSEPPGLSDVATFRLSEAGLAIDRTLAAIDEWSKSVRAQVAPSGLSPSTRLDIERVLAQEIRRAYSSLL
jgi:hypothetical protein